MSAGTAEAGVQPRRIGIIKLSALGDVAKTVQTVRAIRRVHPAAAIAWCIRPVWSGLIEGNPDVDRIIPVPRSLRGLIHGMRALRAFRPDTILDMQGLATSGLLAAASGAPYRYTWQSARELSGLLTGNPIVPGPRDINVAECNFGFARIMGATELPTDPPPYLTIGNPAAAAMRDLLEGLPRPVLAMHIGASEPNKRWPVERWAELASSLVGQGYGVIVLGGGSDRQAAEVVCRCQGAGPSQGNPLMMAGRTTLKELAALVADCDLFVGCDSGATHVAALVGARVVCLMGATLPVHSGPFGPQHRILYLGLTCSPCYRRPTCEGRFDCMTGITVNSVIAACREMLCARGAPGT